MAEFLVFQLAATFASMGELAGHERRGTHLWPGRSAIVGLLGAALGLRREDDFSALDALKIAIAAFDSGTPLRDYHTVQTVPRAGAKNPQSRPQALTLAGANANTTITLRDYRVGSLYGVAVWGGELAPLAEGLKHPGFALYLGRKSCTLSAPPAPQIVSAAGPDGALAQLRLPPWRGSLSATTLFMDSDGGENSGRVEVRHDRAIDRRRWHFASRKVAIRQVSIEAGVAK
jgi:CRISPR system Cascade subunit CasD